MVEYLRNLPVNLVPTRIRNAKQKRLEQEQRVREDFLAVHEEMAEYQRTGKKMPSFDELIKEMDEW